MDMSVSRHVLSFYFIFVTSLPFPISNNESIPFVFLLKSYFLFFGLKWLNLYCLLVWKHAYRHVCIFVCLKKILKHQNTRKLYICLKTRMFGILHICMFVYLKAGCSVFYIIWLISTEWMFAYIETCSFGYMFAIMFLYIFNYQTFKMNQLTSNVFIYMFVCQNVCMFVCLHV